VDDFVVVQDLVKDYPGGARALGGLSFSVRAGEVYGLLGPNGAGKTTTVRILVAMLSLTRGSAYVGGYDVARQPEAVRRMVGYAAQGTGLDIDLSVRENLVLRARLHGLSRLRARQRADVMLGRFDLENLAGRRAGFLSGGQRRRVDLALALVHEPALVVLDEPTTGLDPQARRALWAEIDGLSASRTTVLLTTQQMEEADRLCARVGIVDSGRMVAEDAPSVLKATAGAQTLILEFATLDDALQARIERVVAKTPGLGSPVASGSRVSIPIEDPVRGLAGLLAGLGRDRVEIGSIQVGSPSLEDVYLRLTGLASRPEEASRSGATGLSVAIGARSGEL
jgi:ABC-2 type transport system ATP-binding protein